MSKNYKLEDCDILEINDHMLLVYDDGENPHQKILIMSSSPKMFNDHAIKIFGENEWMEYLLYLYDEFAENVVGYLLDDMYDNHYDTYMTVHAKIHGYYHGDDTCGWGEDCDHCDCCTDDICLTMSVVRTDENGHRWATFDKDSVENLSDEMLCMLADDMEIPNYDLKSRVELVDAICAEESDIDEDDCDCVDDCDGDCDNCEYAELDDRNNDEKIAQKAAPQYENVNGPAHYNGTECIENMRKLFGDEAVRWFCICNAYKYRFRKGNKPGQSAEVDESKAHWYEDYAAKMMSEQRYY